MSIKKLKWATKHTTIIINILLIFIVVMLILNLFLIIAFNSLDNLKEKALYTLESKEYKCQTFDEKLKNTQVMNPDIKKYMENIIDYFLYQDEKSLKKIPMEYSMNQVIEITDDCSLYRKYLNDYEEFVKSDHTVLFEERQRLADGKVTEELEAKAIAIGRVVTSIFMDDDNNILPLCFEDKTIEYINIYNDMKKWMFNNELLDAQIVYSIAKVSSNTYNLQSYILAEFKIDNNEITLVKTQQFLEGDFLKGWDFFG